MPALAVRLGRDRTGVDNGYVGLLTEGYDRKTAYLKAASEVACLREIELASERVKRNARHGVRRKPYEIISQQLLIRMFAREGYIIIAIAWLLVVLISIAVWIVPDLHTWVRMLMSLAAVLCIGVFVLYFFRDPERTPPPGAGDLLLSPADGRIVAIERIHEPAYLRGEAKRISIFLSVFSVHVNRVPATGVIEFERYVPGAYLVAWHPKASEKNERSELGLVHASGFRVLFKQIAGQVARRIVYHVAAGDAVQAGQRLGVIRFGSRMDVSVPSDVLLSVQVGDRVRAGESVFARFPCAAD